MCEKLPALAVYHDFGFWTVLKIKVPRRMPSATSHTGRPGFINSLLFQALDSPWISIFFCCRVAGDFQCDAERQWTLADT